MGLFAQEGLDVEIDLIFPVDRAHAALRDGRVQFVVGSDMQNATRSRQSRTPPARNHHLPKLSCPDARKDQQ
jgi:hypothetical protein